MSEPAPVADWRRLDRRMLLIHPVTEFVRALPGLIALLFAGSSNGLGGVFALVGLAIVLVLALTRWYTTTYRITATQLELRRGLVRRRTVRAALDRVRTVDVTAHAMHRLLGLAKVVIGTGVSDRKGKAELALDGLSAADAAQLREDLLHRIAADDAVAVSVGPHLSAESTVPLAPTSPTATSPIPAETVLVTVPASWVRFAPFTLSGVITSLTVAAFGWRLVNDSGRRPDQYGPLRALAHHVERLSPAGLVIELGLCTVAFIVLASFVGYTLAFWHFRLTRHPGGTLHSTRGLITSRATSIEERRLRGAELSEPLLLRTVGGARVLAVATGLRVGRGAERGGTVLMPPGPRDTAIRVAGDVIGARAPMTVPLRTHGSWASRRRYVRALAVTALLSTAVAVALGWVWGRRAITSAGPTWAVLSLLGMVVAAGLAADRARSLGHALVEGYVVNRFGSLVRRRSALRAEGVIGWTWRRSLFQQRAGLVTLTATTAAGRQGYEIQDVPEADAVALVLQVDPALLTPFLRTGSS